MGWGVSLNGVYLSGGDPSEDLSPECPEQEIVGCLTSPPKGLGPPPQRTEDTTYVQRDGVKHFSDWYEPRIITLEKVSICDTGCGDCSAREKWRTLADQWDRTCCDIELVIFTDCNDKIYDSVPTPELVQERINFMAFNSLGQAYTNECGVFEFTDVRGFGGVPGVYSNFVETTDMPANIIEPQTIARKTWSSDLVSFCRDYEPISGPPAITGWCYDSVCSSPPSGVGRAYDNEIPGNNNGLGFLMGCTGQAGFPVTPGDVWTLSGYMRTNADGRNLLVRAFFYDAAGATIGSWEGLSTPSVSGGWVRPDTTFTIPTNTATMQFALDTASGGPLFEGSDYLDATAVLAEKSAVLGAYFDGTFNDSNDPVLGGFKIDYFWEGAAWGSPSHEATYVYVPGRNRALNGPFGIVGRPRVADPNWLGQGSSCAEVLLRFDGTDHRMYILDECGTPGSGECVQIQPGATVTCRTYDRCYDTTTSGGLAWCYDNEAPGSISVDPTTVNVLGTETAYPIITLNPSLTNPRIEDVTTGHTINYRGTITEGEEPVIINTEDGTAFQGSVSVTHLVDGAFNFTLDPGAHDLRVIVQALDDTGSVQVCWRPAVVAA